MGSESHYEDDTPKPRRRAGRDGDRWRGGEERSRNDDLAGPKETKGSGDGYRRRRSRTPDAGRRRSRDRERDRGYDKGRSGPVMDGISRRGGDRDSDPERGYGRKTRHRSPADSHGERTGKESSLEEEAPRHGRSLVKQSKPLPSQADSFALVKPGEEAEKPKDKPNFENTGFLAAASNAVTQADGTTITLKYHEPSEARKPPARDQWKLYVFKGPDIVDTIDLSRRSCWLVGREMSVVDLAAEHPSISKQHAVIQFRYTEKRNEFGDNIGRVKPYLIDLESANGTMLNKEKIPDSRYLELRDRDMIQFGLSTREYVLILPPGE